jgi:heat shock protein HslJ
MNPRKRFVNGWAVAGAVLFSASAMAAEGPLAATSWRLVEIQSMDDATGTVRPEDPARFTMQLNEDGSVGMVLDCNRANGTWTAEPSADESNGRFEFGPLATTKALCPPPNLDERIAAQAPYIRGYLLKDGRLYLSLMADGGIWAWEPDEPETESAAGSSGAAAGEGTSVPAAPEDGGPRNWKVTKTLNLRESASTNSAIVARFEPGKILDNLGCEQAEDRFWCYVQLLGGGPVGFVAAEFLEPAVSPNGAAMTGPDNSAYRAGQGDFDARGQVRCAQQADQPMTWCDFQVARAGGGYATVVVTLPDGRSRNLYFRMGIAIGAGTSEAENPGEFSMSREGDTTLIRVGEERYEIFDAVVLGG